MAKRTYLDATVTVELHLDEDAYRAQRALAHSLMWLATLLLRRDQAHEGQETLPAGIHCDGAIAWKIAAKEEG